MDKYSDIGFASIKVVLKNGVPIEEPTILHTPPVGMTEADLNIEAIEKFLKRGLSKILQTEKISVDRLGYFIEYHRSEYEIK